MNDRITFASTITTEGRRLKGSVRIAGQQTPRNGELLEVDLDALFRADRTGAVMVVGHQAFSDAGYDPLRTVARATNNTLRITPNSEGFDYETDDLPNTSIANDALELARAGVFGGTSFDIFGLRSKVRTEPGGTRVRRYTSIAKFGAVTPVVEPAFPSTVAAFSKESHVSEETNQEAPEQEAPPAKREPASFSAGSETAEQPATSETFRTAEAFARRQDTKGLEDAMANLIAGGIETAPRQETYDAFAKVYDERKKVDSDATERAERLALAHSLRTGKGPKAPARTTPTESDEYKAAFGQYLRSTRETFSRNSERMEQFAQTISGSGAEGGFTVPDGFVAKLTERLKAFGGIASAASEITTSTGESLRWPYIDDTANKAVIVAEDTQAASGADLVFDSIELGAFEYDATGASGNPIEVSLPLLQDSAFDIEALLLRLLGKRIGRKQADHFATGAGGTEPVGLLSKTADTMTATVASLAAVEQVFQVDSEYRNSGNAKWIMSDTTLAKLWGAQATTNEPLFQPNRTINGKPYDTVMGYPIIIDPSAGNLVAFGDFEAGYIIRRVRGVQLLVDPYTAQKRRAVQYHAWARADANIQDPNAYSVSSWSGVSADT